MNFKNQLEKDTFQIAERVFGDKVTVEHNKTITIESAILPEVASFKGPPSKEVDVLAAEVRDNPRVVLLVSCKALSRKAEPAHVQEWCAVVQTMNKYSDGTLYLGLIVSPSGFTSGCEAWASSHNIGLVPPLKGRSLSFIEPTVLRMFERVLRALSVRVPLGIDDLNQTPAFFDFVFRLVADFEGHEAVAVSGRYYLMPGGWLSSFGEMYEAVAGRLVEDLVATEEGTAIELEGGLTVRFTTGRVDICRGSLVARGESVACECQKNIEGEPCSLEFVKSCAIGKSVTSAGDFGSYLEFGLDQRLNLGLHQQGFHVVSTANPIEKHRL